MSSHLHEPVLLQKHAPALDPSDEAIAGAGRGPESAEVTFAGYLAGCVAMRIGAYYVF